MIEFVKPLSVLLLAAFLAGFALSLTTGSNRNPVQSEYHAMESLVRSCGTTFIKPSADTLLDESGTKHIFRLLASGGMIVRIENVPTDSQVLLAIVDANCVPQKACVINPDIGPDVLYNRVYTAFANGNFQRLRAEYSGTALPVPQENWAAVQSEAIFVKNESAFMKKEAVHGTR